MRDVSERTVQRHWDKARLLLDRFLDKSNVTRFGSRPRGDATDSVQLDDRVLHRIRLVLRKSVCIAANFALPLFVSSTRKIPIDRLFRMRNLSPHVE